MVAISSQALQKSALAVIPVSRSRKGPDISMLRSNIGSGEVARKAENSPAGEAHLEEEGWKQSKQPGT